MAQFVRCSCENTKYRGHPQHNSPVNIDLVTQIVKAKETYYPDNEGTPAIEFKGIDIKWVYGSHQQKERDADYEKILKDFERVGDRPSIQKTSGTICS